MYALANKYPINDAGQLKTAADYFDKYLSRFDAGDRTVIATNLEKQAQALHVDLGMGWVANYSRCLKDGAAYSPDFDQNMGMRKHACESGKIMIKIGEQVMPAAPLVEKLAAKKGELSPHAMMSAIDHLDKTAGITSLYDSRILDPVFTVFGSLANPEYDAVKVAEGVTDYGMRKFACVDGAQAKIEAALGKQVAEAFMKEPIESFNKLGATEKSAMAEVIRK